MRYSTAEEDTALVDLVATLIPTAKAARVASTARRIAGWLGPNYQAGKTRHGNYWFQSADGQRRFRVDLNAPRQGRWNGPHGQFEVRNSRGQFEPHPGAPQHIPFGGR